MSHAVHSASHWIGQGTFCSVSRRESRCKLRRSLINNKNTSEKSRIIVLILLTLLVCHLLAPRGGRLVGNKSGHSYSFTSPTNDFINTKSVAYAMTPCWLAMSVSIIYAEASDVKHVLSTLFIEHTPSAGCEHSVVFPNLFFARGGMA